MYTVAGVTGHVGSAVATTLLAAGQSVRVVVREPAKGEAWRARGAQPTVADLRDADELARALTGSDGFFTLLPFNLAAPDIAADQRHLADAIVDAVTQSRVPHVVMLSSVGADLADGPEVVAWLGELESRLRSTGAVVTAVRSGHFQENVRDVLPAAQGSGVFPVFASTADRPISLVATRDVGGAAAAALMEPPADHQIVDVEGPAYTQRQVAALLGEALGRPLDVVTIPRADWIGALTEAGVPADAAALLAGLYAADDDLRLQPRRDRHVKGSTPLEATLRALLDPTTVSA